MPKARLNLYLDPGLLDTLDALATRRGVSRSQLIEVALQSLLTPDFAEQTEATTTRRLDRLNRSVERLERETTLTAEALGLFIRFWLTATPPLPEALDPAAQAKGRERYANFLTTLGRRLAKGKRISAEVAEVVEG